MQFNVADLLKATMSGRRRADLDEDIGQIDGEIEALSHLTGRVIFTRTVDGVLVTGTLHVVLRAICPRCLEPYPYDVEISLEEEFLPSVDILTGASLPVSGETDRAVIIDQHHILDLTEVVREYLVIAQTTCPPCRPDCAGLCPQCGQNLNQGQCACHETGADPRFAVLKQLLIDN